VLINGVYNITAICKIKSNFKAKRTRLWQVTITRKCA